RPNASMMMWGSRARRHWRGCLSVRRRWNHELDRGSKQRDKHRRFGGGSVDSVEALQMSLNITIPRPGLERAENVSEDALTHQGEALSPYLATAPKFAKMNILHA